MKVKNKKVKKNRWIDIIKDSAVKLKDDTAEFIDEHYVAVATVGCGLAIGGLFYTAKICSLGIALANKNIIHMYYEGDIGTGDGILFNHRVDIDEWVQYLEMLYSKTGKKKETRLEWLKDNGYID
jgi:hypothetical protein